MTKNKNALAELAETLKNGYVSLVVNDRKVATFTTAAFPELDKAQRIIAELAKVRDTNWSAGYNYPEPNSSSVAVSKCREIAEEGGVR